MYLLDANILIEASRKYYSFAIAPSFWDWILEQHAKGNFASIKAVQSELIVGKDDLASWARKVAPKTFWLPPTDAMVGYMAQLMSWANSPSQNYTQAAIEEFAQVADLELIAQAKAIDAEILTHEVSIPNASRRIPLPDAAASIGVSCANPWEVFTKYGLRL